MKKTIYNAKRYMVDKITFCNGSFVPDGLSEERCTERLQFENYNDLIDYFTSREYTLARNLSPKLNEAGFMYDDSPNTTFFGKHVIKITTGVLL